MANTKDFWFPIRPFQWLAEPDENFSLDAFRAYMALCCIGAGRTITADEEVSFSPLFITHAVPRVFINENGRKHPTARFKLAIRALEERGLLNRAEDRYHLSGVAGEPYRRSVRTDRKRGNFLMAKCVLGDQRTDGSPAPLLLLDPEETLLLSLLYHGARWVWGGVHNQYVQLSSGGTVIVGAVVEELLTATRRSDKANGYGLTTTRTSGQIVQSLIDKGFFVWLKALLAHVSNKGGEKLSTQRTVVLSRDLRHGEAVRNELYGDVLVPRYGYSLASLQPEIVKAVYAHDLVYYDPNGTALSFADCATLKLWGVDRWRIGTPRKTSGARS